MAIFTYECKEHGRFKVSIEKRLKAFCCLTCGKECMPIIKAGTARVVERLDNGVMGRAVERLHNIEEIMDERDKNHSVKQDDDEDV
jgi:hypothetical protein